MVGERGDKHPRMKVYIEESQIPRLRGIWEQGRMVEFFLILQAAMRRGEIMTPDQLWERLLSLDSEHGRHARMIEEGAL